MVSLSVQGDWMSGVSSLSVRGVVDLCEGMRGHFILGLLVLRMFKILIDAC